MGLLALFQRAYPVPIARRESYGVRSPDAPPTEYGNYLATSNEVFAAASLRARLMSSVDLRLYRGTGPERSEVLTGAAKGLLQRVNPFWTWERLSRMDELSMCLWGESFWAVEPGRGGVPAEIWWLKPTQVTPVPDPSGYIRGFMYRPADGGREVAFTASEIVWFRYPNPLNEFTAISPLAAARLAADTASAMMKANRNLFSKGLQIAGLVVPDKDRVTFSEPQAKELQDMLDTRLSGTDKAHRWAVLRYDAQFRPMSVSPKDAEFIEGLNLTMRQVCNAYGIPSPLLNDMEHATLSNAREYERILWAHALVPDAKLRASDVREQFLPLFRGDADHAEFDFTSVPALQEAVSDVWAREYQAMQEGALTINDWRTSKGLPPVPWGDLPWMPVNKVQWSPEPAAEPPAATAQPPEPVVPPEEMPRTVREFLARAGLNGSH